MFSFTGNKNSIRGDINFYGKGGVQFFTEIKTVIARWKEESESSHSMSTSMPLHK
jgi:malonate-semialdehyde dehydrogenase (acetylating)/methylmalonate-semialdehyde dehydrogenase